MKTAESASFKSLYMVRDELVATIDQAARDLELYLTAPDELQSLHASVDGIQQVRGIMQLLDFKGAVLLTEELLATAKTITTDDSGSQNERRLSAISRTFFVLARYIEYVQQAERKFPVLLIPYINELRKTRGESALAESHFFDVNLSSFPAVPATGALQVADENFKALLGRLRHMYQLGLLNVLRDSQVKASLGLMRHALIRLQRLGSDKPLALLWWMGNLAIEAMLSQQMELITSRKMLLSRIDRVVRQVQQGGRAAYRAAPPKGLIKELLYVLLLSGVNNQQVRYLKQAFGVGALPFTEHELMIERRALAGPSSQTVGALVRVLHTEINNIKKVLESASQGMQIIDDVEGFNEALVRTADTLAVVGMIGPSTKLKQALKLTEHWSNSQPVGEESLDRFAQILLYVESAVSSLENIGMPREGLSDGGEDSQVQMVTLGELFQAEKIVLQECEAGLSLCKRAITAYSESNFDMGHIRNIAKTLNTVRGGLHMLNLDRAASIVGRCGAFVEQVLMEDEQPAALKELLETFADAIISIEYYLNTGKSAARLDESTLQIAEESIAALGYGLDNPPSKTKATFKVRG